MKNTQSNPRIDKMDEFLYEITLVENFIYRRIILEVKELWNKFYQYKKL